MSTSAGSGGADDERDDARPRRTFARFLLVGFANASIDIGVYLALSAAGLGIVVANLISTSCGLIFSFFANRSFTFGARASTRRAAVIQAALFLLVVGIGLWAIQPLIILAVTWGLEQWFTLPTWSNNLVAKAAAIGVALVWNYAMFRVLVFRTGSGPSPAGPRT